MAKYKTLADAEEAYRKGKLSKQQICQFRNIAEGKCVTCGQPQATKYDGTKDQRCEYHRAVQLEYARKMRAEKGMKQNLCSNCGEPGHNVRTCENA